MRRHKTQVLYFGWALSLTMMLATVAPAASSFSNSLTGFTGDSTQAGTQATLGTAGFNFFSTDGLDAEFTMDPTVAFDANGAVFGSFYAGDGGRNYMRTVESDYATVSFVAEMTVERVDNNQQVFIGMGSGDTALFGVPDWSTLFSSTFVTPEDGSLTTWRSSNDVSEWLGDDPPSAVTAGGTHRVRMEYDKDARTMTYSIDLDYAGGAFTADVTAPTVDLNDVTCPGSDCGGGKVANFFGDKVWDASDYTLWRNRLGSSDGDFYVGNFDNTGDSMDVVDQADYEYWKAHFGEVRSQGWPNDPSRIYFGGDDGTIIRDFSVAISGIVGSGGAAGVVPEPSTIVLLAWVLGSALALARSRYES